jgi:predicted methyltransferase
VNAPAASSTAGAAVTAAKLRAAVDGSHRSDKEKARDAWLHPIETLTFFGLRDDMTVVELSPDKG